jgi:hypothetical protein
MRQFMKGMLLLLMVLVCSQGMANGIVQEKTIWKILQIDNEFDKRAILISDDYEIWLLHGLQPNRLTWNEWIWREEVPQPDASFFLDIKKWEEGKPVSIVYSPWHECKWKDSYRNDDSLLQYCEYVIDNDDHNAHVFATPLQMDEWKSLYTKLREDMRDLANLGFYGRAANLLEKEILFLSFREKILTEWKNKIDGNPFDEQYTTFNEKYDLFQLDDSR